MDNLVFLRAHIRNSDSADSIPSSALFLSKIKWVGETPADHQFLYFASASFASHQQRKGRTDAAPNLDIAIGT